MLRKRHEEEIAQVKSEMMEYLANLRSSLDQVMNEMNIIEGNKQNEKGECSR